MKYNIKLAIAIFFICILSNSSIISTSLLIKRRNTRRHKLTRTNAKLEDNLVEMKQLGWSTGFFVCGAFAKCGIPFASSIAGAFTTMALKARQFATNSSVEINAKTYTCDMNGLNTIYNGTIETIKERNKQNLVDAKRALEDCIVNFKIDTSLGDKHTCQESKKHLTKLRAEGKSLTKDKVLVIRKITSFLADKAHYQRNLKKSVFESKYECIKKILKKMKLLKQCRSKDGCEADLEPKLSKIKHLLETDNQEGLSYLYIAEDMFGILLEMDCDKITDMGDDDKIDLSTKAAAVWQTAGFMKKCVEKESAVEPTWKKSLIITTEIVLLVGDIVLSLMCFGVLKIIRSILKGCQALYALYQAKRCKDINNTDEYSLRMGEAVGYVINMVLGLVIKSKRLKK